jgi:hypothetical protein
VRRLVQLLLALGRALLGVVLEVRAGFLGLVAGLFAEFLGLVGGVAGGVLQFAGRFLGAFLDRRAGFLDVGVVGDVVAASLMSEAAALAPSLTWVACSCEQPARARVTAQPAMNRIERMVVLPRSKSESAA